MSRLSHAHPGVRPALKARALLSGPPGAGKTRSGLIIAEQLADGGPVLVIDTEKESALTYADEFAFDHLPWRAPFNPRELGTTLIDAGKSYAVVMVDSLAHFWRGDGGVLDIASGKFTGWADARPAQADMVDALLSCDAHFIGCVRSKVAHEQVQEGGRWVVKKLGLQVIQDDDLEYEMNVALELDMDHSITVSKSRTIVVPVGRNFKAGHAEDFAQLYKDWLAGGEPLATKAETDALRARVEALPTKEQRVALKQEFKSHLGMIDHLRASQVPHADALIAEHEAAANEAPEAEAAG